VGSSAAQDTLGDADTAIRWIRDADLPPHDKQSFTRFVERFPTLTFTRDTEETLAEAESGHGVVLPPHLRRARSVLSFVSPPLLALFDGFDYECGASESEVDIWYGIGLGNAGDDMLSDLAEHAHGYVIGGWHGSEGSYLMVDTANADDERVFECDGVFIAYAVDDGDPVDELVAPAFASYASMLGHIVALRTWAGEVTTAR